MSAAIESYLDFYRLENRSEPTPEEMRGLMNAYVEALARYGKRAVAYRSEELALFQKAKAKARVRAAMHLRLNIEVLNEHHASDEADDDVRRMTWRMIKKAKLTPADDIIHRIDDGDIVEIYLLREQLQIYRSPSFFDVCTFSIEELLFEPWYRLTTRPILSTLAVSRTVMRLQFGLLKRTVPWNVAPHPLEERYGERRKIMIAMKWLSPLFEKSNAVAVLSTNSSYVI